MKRLGSRACVVYGPATMVAPPFFARPLAGSLGDHVRRTLRLALPVVGARAGLLILVVVDTAMTGHSSAVELAYFGLAMAPQVPMLLVGIGLLLGTVVLVAQADGAGDHAACGAVWRVALVHAVVIGVAFGLLSQLGEPFLALVDQSPDLAAGGGRVIAMLGWGMPAALGYAATTFFLEGINRRTPLRLRLVDLGQRDPATSFTDKVEELYPVQVFLLGLHAHPVRHALEVLGLEVRRHRKVEVRRKELGVELLVESVLDLGIHHDDLSRFVSSRRTHGDRRSARSPSSRATPHLVSFLR